MIVGWCAVLFLYGLDAGPLYRTESLRAIIGRACLNGHWLYPVLYGEPFLTKPPGHYAAIGLCSVPFGEVSAATARLPSVLAAVLAVVLMHATFRRAMGERAGLLVAALLPCSVLWLDKVPSAEIDMTLVGWVTAALVLFHRALEAEDERERQQADERQSQQGADAPRAPRCAPRPAPNQQGADAPRAPRCAPRPAPNQQGAHAPRSPVWIGALLCVAAGTLTKWTAPAFFYLTAVPLLAWRGRLGLLFGWRHLLAVSIAVAVCAGWAVAVVQQVGWDALADTIRKEAAYRFAPKAHKGYPWGDVIAYPLAVFAAHLPVSGFAVLTFRKSFWAGLNGREKRLLQLLHCWTWPNLLFWTLVPNHNVRYALPMSAGLMGLGVMGLWVWWRRPSHSGSEKGSASGRPTSPTPLPASGKPTPPTPLPAGRGEKDLRTPVPWGGSREALPGFTPSLDRRGVQGEPVGGSTFSAAGGRGVGFSGGRGVGLPYFALAFLLCWLVVKVVFVELVIPTRTANRNAETTAAELRRRVPEGAPLYVFRLKDEGVTFYYARPVVKLSGPAALPPGAVALLIEQEWEDRAAFGRFELVCCMCDQQGDAMFLVRNP